MDDNKEIVSSLSIHLPAGSLKKRILFQDGGALNRLAVIAILLLLPIIFFAPPLIGGRSLMSIQNAESLLRSPLSAGTSPSGFYALNALLDSLSPITYVNVIVIVAYQLALVGIYLFGRRLGMNVIGAVTAAAAFTFGGLVIFLVGDIGTISYVTSAIWIPWIMLATENLRQSQRWRWVVIGSLCTAVQVFFGATQMVLFTFLTGLAYAVYRLTCRGKRLYFATTVAMMWLCGFALAKAQVKAIMDAARQDASNYSVADLLHSGSGITTIIYLTLLILLSLLVANRREHDKRSLGFWTVVALSCILFALIIPEVQQTIRYLYETRVILSETGINRLFAEPIAYLYVCILCGSILLGFSADFILPAWRENTARSLLSISSAMLLFITAAVIGASLTWKNGQVLAEQIARLKSEPWEEYIKTQAQDSDTFRIFTHSLKPKDKTPAENIAAHNLSRSSLNPNSMNSKVYETISAENASSIFKGLNGGAALPDVNTLTSRNQIANLLNVKYLILERSGEPVPPPQIQAQGIKFDQSSIPLRLEPGKRHSEILPPGAPASEIAIISTMGGATNLIDNTPVAKVKLHTKDGRVITQEILAGRDTGEWSYDNPEIRRNIKHRRPTIALDTSSNGVFSYQYLMRLPFERSEIAQIEFDYLLTDAVLLINHISLFDSETGASAPLSSFDIITEQWRKLAQHGDVEIYRNRNFLPRAWFIKKSAVASRAGIKQILDSGVMPDGSMFNPSDTALLESENLRFRGVKSPEIGDPIDPIVTVSQRLRDKILLEVQNNRSGLLVLSELYRDGLACYVDGRPTDVLRVNYTLSGIAVPAGKHAIQFVYRSFVIDSKTLYALLGIIILSAVAVALGIRADRILDAGRLRKWIKVWVPKVRSYRPAFFTGPIRSIARSRIIGVIRSIIQSRIVTFIRFKHLIALAVLGLLAAYGYAMVRYSTFSLGGCDTFGYGSCGKMIYQGQFVKTVRLLADLDLPADLQDAFIPLAYGPGKTPGAMICNYPIGFPLQIAVASMVFGVENGPWMVSSLAATLSLILIWLICLEFGLSRKLAFAGAVILGLFPTIPYIGIQLLSDVPAMFWCLAVIFAALRSRKNQLWAIVAGFAFGVGFITRPTNILLIGAALLSLKWSFRAISYFVIGGLPVACVFFIYNFTALGNPIYMGYAVSGAGGNFHLHFLPIHFKQFTYWLSMLTSPLLLTGWLAVTVNKQISLRDRFIIIIWFGAFFFLYCLYGLQYDTDADWTYTRFLLPCIPPLIIGSLMTMRYVVDSLKMNIDPRYHNIVSRFAFGFLLVVVIGVSISRIVRLDIQHFASNFGRHKESCLWADKIMPQDALVISMEMGGSIEYYANRQTLRYDQVNPAQWNRIKDNATRKGRSFYAFLMTHEVPLAKKSITGNWEELGVYKTLFTLWKVTPE